VLERVEVGGGDAGVAGERGAHPVALEAEALQAGGEGIAVGRWCLRIRPWIDR